MKMSRGHSSIESMDKLSMIGVLPARNVYGEPRPERHYVTTSIASIPRLNGRRSLSPGFGRRDGSRVDAVHKIQMVAVMSSSSIRSGDRHER